MLKIVNYIALLCCCVIFFLKLGVGHNLMVFENEICVIKSFNLKEHIKKNVIIGLEDRKQKWSQNNINLLTDVLHVGYKEFEIDPNDVLAIISIESWFTIKAFNRNSAKSFDYGLTQINNINWNKLTNRSIKIFKKHNFVYSKCHSKYDIAINVMNCFVYFDGTKRVLSLKKLYTKKRWIQSYNTGIRGSLSNKKRHKKRRTKYWNLFWHKRKLFL